MAASPIERIRPENPEEPVKDVGWVIRGRGEHALDAYFPDAVYGGDDAAYLAAESWLSAAQEGPEAATSEDTKNITRVEIEREEEEGWKLEWLRRDGSQEGSGQVGSNLVASNGAETFAATEHGGARRAFEGAVERMREIADTVALVAPEPDAVRVEVTDERGVLISGGEELAEVVPFRRVKRGETKGYQVRLMRQGTKHSKFFPDNLSGGKSGALRAAQYWRDLKKGTVGGARKDSPGSGVRLPEAEDKYLASAIQTSQFGVPRMRVVLLERGGAGREPYLRVEWPVAGGGVRSRKASLEGLGAAEATRRLCRLLVRARRRSKLTSEEMGHRKTAFAVVDGWFAAKEGMSVEAEAEELFGKVFPKVERKLREVMEEEESRRRGIPGVDVRIQRNPGGRYAPYLYAEWKQPSGGKERVLEEVYDDVEGALERLCEALLARYQEHPSRWELRLDESSPFSAIDTSSKGVDDRVSAMVEVGLPDVKAKYERATEGVGGIRVIVERYETLGGERAYTAVEVGWPAKRKSRHRRTKGFDGMGELKSALYNAVLRSLVALREGEVEDVGRAVGGRSPFAGLELRELADDESLEKVARRLTRRALPALRLQYQRLEESGLEESGEVGSGGR